MPITATYLGSGDKEDDFLVQIQKQHYDRVLADHYLWLAGGYAEMLPRQLNLLKELGLSPSLGGRALDLGCGPGFHSLALAQLGFQVTAVDTSRKLLNELIVRLGTMTIEVVEGDLRHIDLLASPGFAAAVCMGDTLTHLPSRAAVIQLFSNVYNLLDEGGNFVLGFRDYSNELVGVERFIPVKNEANRIATCFLEYESEVVIVHDLIHLRDGAFWKLHKGSYRKLRLASGWVANRLGECGFVTLQMVKIDGMSVILARKRT